MLYGRHLKAILAFIVRHNQCLQLWRVASKYVQGQIHPTGLVADTCSNAIEQFLFLDVLLYFEKLSYFLSLTYRAKLGWGIACVKPPTARYKFVYSCPVKNQMEFISGRNTPLFALTFHV